MPVCTFCKKQYDDHKGLTVYTFDGKTIRYCSGKCRKNVALKRDPRKTNWVKKEKVKKSEKKQEKIENKIEKRVEKDEKNSDKKE